jgi:EAL domain-containing protein (putative c-di-GMP-specific phosphodiesterase class I)
LNSMDCELGQGYYFAKPLPAHNLEDVLRDGLGMFRKDLVGEV